MKPLIWIIDEEWPDHDIEHRMLREKFPDCRIELSSHDFHDDLDRFGKLVDGLICQIQVALTRELLAGFDRLKAVSVYGTGYDRIDVAAAGERGIAVTNVGGYSNEDLADYVMAAIYHFYKNLPDLAAEVQELPWGAQAMPAPPLRLNRSVLHILGLGRIGRETAAKALANGLIVTAYDPYVSVEDMRKIGVRKTDWDEGLRDADYVSIHLALNEHTAGSFKYEDFARMKPTACLINAARGQIIDEDGMVRALHQGLIRGAMLDTLTTEPPSYSENIFDCPRVFITPHVSFISVQSFEELRRRAVENLIISLEGGKSSDLVNSAFLNAQ